MRIRLLDLDRGGAVELEVDEKAHPTSIIEKLREMGLVSRYETVMFGVTPNGRQIFYVPAATIEQLVAYSNQTKQPISFRRFPIHGYGKS
ncbi:hypothetical protein [Pyrobaculum aerophilum]|uniref:Uncharacterized protein n=2 Tax=Pyrobaculum aerophilum TaxID=13773 RepID=A0A371R5Z3_9CREN|nr:hypothetical protein [Pyrobaculum aerophilum]RFA97740.1 hypothetical protein CGL51_02160 [Pyrobaculum aerophilum]RFA99505.1 hypothetical protein CGL52_02925 [Pyrobaculum aerophilum]